MPGCLLYENVNENENEFSHFNTESDLHQRRSVEASGLALPGIVLMIGIVAEHCEGLTIPTVDHSPPINAGCLADVVSEDGAFAPFFCAAERRHNQGLCDGPACVYGGGWSTLGIVRPPQCSATTPIVTSMLSSANPPPITAPPLFNG